MAEIGRVAHTTIFLFALVSLSCVSGVQFLRRRSNDRAGRPNIREHARSPVRAIGRTSTAHPFLPAGKQTVTKQCGLTGDGNADSFGLAAQFISSERRKRRDTMDHDTMEWENVEGRSFKMVKRKISKDGQRIIGGNDTTATRICWQVLVVATTTSGETQLCGGIIIGSQTVLTVGQCLLDQTTRLQLLSSAFQVVVGAINSGAPATNIQDTTGCAQTLGVTSAVLNPNYNDAVNDNDLAVLTLSSPINIDQKACACILCLKSRQPVVGETCVVSGYGVEVASGTVPRDPVPLKWVAQKVVAQTDSTALCPVFQDSTGATTDVTDFICTVGAVGQDPCLEDQGGPLACYDPTTSSHYLAGLISFGQEVCGQGLGTQNTKIANYLTWIVQTALPNDVVIADGSVTAPPTTIPTSTIPSSSTLPASTFLPPTGAKQCGLPGNNAVDPFGIESQFAGKSLKRRHFPGGNPFPVKMRFRPSLRIIGGFDAPESEICWQAYILANLPTGEGSVTCGGIIIGAQTILTTATCVVDLSGILADTYYPIILRNAIVASSIFVNVGALDSNAPTTNANDPLACAEQYSVQTSLLHPQYLYATNDNDIAILTLSQTINIQNKACACTICLTDRLPALNETCIMSGYGFETADQTFIRDPIPLKWVKQSILQQNVGSLSPCPGYQGTGTAITNLTNFICTDGVVGQDQCLGDSGGALACFNPVTSSYYAAGIISIPPLVCGSGEGGQSVKVANYLQWIADNSLAGDVFINSSSVVTRPTVATTPTTTPLSTTSTSTLSTTTTTTTTTTGSGSRCGLPGNGLTDPFNLTAQFTSSGTLKHASRVTFFNGARIVGGAPALAREICWQVLVIGNLGNDFVQYCGGVIIGSRTILTAGHCAFNGDTGAQFAASDLRVVVGSLAFPATSDTSGCAQTLTVSQIIPNPDFNQNNLDNDISLVILDSALDFTGTSCYCTICVTDKLPLVGETCVVSGFGSQTTSDTATQDVTFLAWLPQKVRTQSYDGSCEVLVDSTTGTQTDLDDFICAGGQAGEDTCHGDSGGPFFCYNPATSSHYVAGLTSFGTDPCGTTTGSQYTKVAHYLPFISSNAPADDVNIIITGTVTTPMTTSTSSTSTTTTATTVLGETTSSTQPPSSTSSSFYLYNMRRFHG